MASLEERVSRLEGGYEHLATKADLERIYGSLQAEMRAMETRLIKWMVGMMIASIAAASSIALFVQRLIG